MDKLSLPEFDGERAMHLSLGAVSPLWFVYAGAGAAGAAYYWMSRWYAATNLEAMTSFFEGPSATEVIKVAEVVAEPIVEAMPEPVAEVIAAVIPEPAAPPEPVAELEPDDLTVLVGIGPKLSASLAERGLTRYAHIAALTPKKIARLDKQMKLMGRIERDAWVAQAKRLTTQG
jgi:predicted flap endonuclease-1-like 5' DNA nuclease